MSLNEALATTETATLQQMRTDLEVRKTNYLAAGMDSLAEDCRKQVVAIEDELIRRSNSI